MTTKKKRDIFSRYKTYEGEPGSTAQWRAQAQAIVANQGKDVPKSLQALGLASMPTDLASLQKARRKVMLTAHPDKAGGSHDTATAINEAFDHLSRLIASRTPPQAQGPIVTPTADAISRVINPPRCVWELPEDLTAPYLLADLKIDGERVIAYLNLNPYSGARKTTLLSRHKGKHTKQYGDKTTAVLGDEYPGMDGTILDAELFQGRMICFDVLFDRGRDVRQLPLFERRELLKKIVADMNNPSVEVISYWVGVDIEAKFQEIVGAGGEGLVIKDGRAAYGQCWAKMKKSYDVSCVITSLNDTDKGQGSMTISVYNNGVLEEVGRFNGGDASWIGRVVDVFAQELTVHGKIRHASFHRFRDDINAEICTLDKLKDDMKKAALAERRREKA